MANQSDKNQGRRWSIYYRDTGEKIPVSKAEYDVFYKDADRIRHNEQRNGRCVCPKRCIGVCDGDCLSCNYHIQDEMVSLDATNPDGSGICDCIAYPGKSVEDMVADRDLLDNLIKLLHELDPDADTIIKLWYEHPEGISESAIARTLGRSQQKFSYQMRKYRSIMKDRLSK